VNSVLEGSRVIVVVPAFCEAQHVAEVLNTMPEFVDTIVLVDDASTDQTQSVARATCCPRLVIATHPERRGVGAAIATGYRIALAHTTSRTDALCVMAGDGQMDPADLQRVAEPVVRNEADYVKGDRFVNADVRKSMGLPRWVGGQVFSRLTALAIGEPIHDSQCGFTALARSAATLIDLDGLWPSFGYPNDLLGQIKARRLRISEVPVRPVYGDETSKLRLRHLPPIFYLIARAGVRRARST
jgi:glycosyltransferase involved in cell wall biosynthesis